MSITASNTDSSSEYLANSDESSARLIAGAGNVFGVVWPPAVFGIVLLTVWEVFVQAFDIQPYFLPAPSAIATELVDNLDTIWSATLASGANAFLGLLAGALVGVAGAFLLMRFRILDELASPLAVALNAVPIVVLVTIFQGQYPSTSEMPRRIMVLLIVMFIILVNVAKGLRQVDVTHLELMRSYAASEREILVKARIPNAIPYFFTALKIAAPTAVITAFVAEYFGGRQNGLGYFIPSNFAGSKNAVAWAYVIGACALGLVFYLASIALEYLAATKRGQKPGGKPS